MLLKNINVWRRVLRWGEGLGEVGTRGPWAGTSPGRTAEQPLLHIKGAEVFVQVPQVPGGAATSWAARAHWHRVPFAPLSPPGSWQHHLAQVTFPEVALGQGTLVLCHLRAW